MKVITDYDNQKSGLLLLYIIIFTIYYYYRYIFLPYGNQRRINKYYTTPKK